MMIMRKRRVRFLESFLLENCEKQLMQTRRLFRYLKVLRFDIVVVLRGFENHLPVELHVCD